eukprot:TRINITY_DN8129_c1_g1_i1.p1 TRINITY_DN8129_c1_g1~~TRINITY_DN8129_c1_g1_i1.p1  ORF type:complete len:1351 (-),score=419.24 TRINITY_DN8129_c1_g1_i1:139-4191(-)
MITPKSSDDVEGKAEEAIICQVQVFLKSTRNTSIKDGTLYGVFNIDSKSLTVRSTKRTPAALIAPSSSQSSSASSSSRASNISPVGAVSSSVTTGGRSKSFIGDEPPALSLANQNSTTSEEFVWPDEQLVFFLENDTGMDISIWHEGDGKQNPSLLGDCTVKLRSLSEGTGEMTEWLTLMPPPTVTKSIWGKKGAKAYPEVLVSIKYFKEKITAASLFQNSPYTSFLNILSMDDHTIAHTLCELVDMLAEGEEAERFAASLVGVYTHTQQILALVRGSVRREVTATNTTNILFRSNSMALRLLTEYAKIIDKSYNYLYRVLSPHIIQINSVNRAQEVSMEVVPADLEEQVESILDDVLGSISLLSTELRCICAIIRIEVSSKFPDFWLTAVGAFFFLRFLCPALVSPKSPALSALPEDLPLTPSGRRRLILCSKVLQNIANGRDFRETSLVPLNGFVRRHIPRLHVFFREISDPSVLSLSKSDFSKKDMAGLVKDVSVLLHYSSLYAPKIVATADASPFQPSASSATAAVIAAANANNPAPRPPSATISGGSAPLGSSPLGPSPLGPSPSSSPGSPASSSPSSSSSSLSSSTGYTSPAPSSPALTREERASTLASPGNAKAALVKRESRASVFNDQDERVMYIHPSLAKQFHKVILAHKHNTIRPSKLNQQKNPGQIEYTVPVAPKKDGPLLDGCELLRQGGAVKIISGTGEQTSFLHIAQTRPNAIGKSSHTRSSILTDPSLSTTMTPSAQSGQHGSYVYDDDEDEVLNAPVDKSDSVRRNTQQQQQVRDLCEVAEVLARSGLNLFEKFIKELAKSQNTLSWELFEKNDDFSKFRAQTCDLRDISITELRQGHSARLCFWINVYNTLSLHIYLSTKGAGDLNSRRGRQSFFHYYKYRVGPYLVSLADIRDGILRGNPKESVARHRPFRGWDPRRVLILPLDPRIHFALSHLVKSGPIPRAYTAGYIDSQLQTAGETYLSQHFRVNPTTKQITLPSVFASFPTDFPPYMEASGQYVFEADYHPDDMLKWLFQFLSNTVRLDLLTVMSSSHFNIVHTKRAWEPPSLQSCIAQLNAQQQHEAIMGEIVSSTSNNANSTGSSTSETKPTPIHSPSGGAKWRDASKAGPSSRGDDGDEMKRHSIRQMQLLEETLAFSPDTNLTTLSKAYNPTVGKDLNAEQAATMHRLQNSILQAAERIIVTKLGSLWEGAVVTPSLTQIVMVAKAVKAIRQDIHSFDPSLETVHGTTMSSTIICGRDRVTVSTEVMQIQIKLTDEQKEVLADRATQATALLTVLHKAIVELMHVVRVLSHPIRLKNLAAEDLISTARLLLNGKSKLNAAIAEIDRYLKSREFS